MKLQEGKRYVTRSGRVTGPLRRTNCPLFVYQADFSDNFTESWDSSGSCNGITDHHEMDLVAEYVEEEKQPNADLEKERREFWVKAFFHAWKIEAEKNTPIPEIADLALAEFDKRFNK